MAEIIERVSVLEVQVTNLDEKIDEIKSDVKGIKNGVENSKRELKEQLDTMYEASCTQHTQLATKITALESFKNKWFYLILGGGTVVGWILGHSQAIIKILGFFSK